MHNWIHSIHCKSSNDNHKRRQSYGETSELRILFQVFSIQVNSRGMVFKGLDKTHFAKMTGECKVTTKKSF